MCKSTFLIHFWEGVTFLDIFVSGDDRITLTGFQMCFSDSLKCSVQIYRVLTEVEPSVRLRIATESPFGK